MDGAKYIEPHASMLILRRKDTKRCMVLRSMQLECERQGPKHHKNRRGWRNSKRKARDEENIESKEKRQCTEKEIRPPVGSYDLGCLTQA